MKTFSNPSFMSFFTTIVTPKLWLIMSFRNWTTKLQKKTIINKKEIKKEEEGRIHDE
jgi:hypothetical protein